MSAITGNSSNPSSSPDCRKEVLAPLVAPDTQSGMFSRIFSVFSRNPTAPKLENKYKFVDSDFVFLNALEKTCGHDFESFQGIWLTEEKEFQPFNTLNDKLTAKNKFKVSYTEKKNPEGKGTGDLGMRVSLQGENQKQCQAHIEAIRTELATPVAESETKSKVQEFFRKLQKTAAENAEITQKFDLLIQGVRTLKELSTATTSTQSEPLPTEQTLLPVSESEEIEVEDKVQLNLSAAEDNLFQTIAELGILWNSNSDDGFDNAIKQLEARKPTLFSPWASAIEKNYTQTVDSASPASFKTNWKWIVDTDILKTNVSTTLANKLRDTEAYSVTKIAAFVASLPVMAARVVSSLIWRPLAVIVAVAMTIFQKISASKESFATNLLIEKLNASNMKPEVIENQNLKHLPSLNSNEECIDFFQQHLTKLKQRKQEKIEDLKTLVNHWTTLTILKASDRSSGHLETELQIAKEAMNEAELEIKKFTMEEEYAKAQLTVFSNALLTSAANKLKAVSVRQIDRSKHKQRVIQNQIKQFKDQTLDKTEIDIAQMQTNLLESQKNYQELIADLDAVAAQNQSSSTSCQSLLTDIKELILQRRAKIEQEFNENKLVMQSELLSLNKEQKDLLEMNDEAWADRFKRSRADRILSQE